MSEKEIGVEVAILGHCFRCGKDYPEEVHECPPGTPTTEEVYAAQREAMVREWKKMMDEMTPERRERLRSAARKMVNPDFFKRLDEGDGK